MKLHEYGALIILEYDNRTLYQQGGEKRLTRDQQIQVENWYHKRAQSLPRHIQTYFNMYEGLRHKILDNIVFQAYWKGIKDAKEFIDYILYNYIEAGYELPEIRIQVNNLPTR